MGRSEGLHEGGKGVSVGERDPPIGAGEDEGAGKVGGGVGFGFGPGFGFGSGFGSLDSEGDEVGGLVGKESVPAVGPPVRANDGEGVRAGASEEEDGEGEKDRAKNIDGLKESREGLGDGEADGDGKERVPVVGPLVRSDDDDNDGERVSWIVEGAGDKDGADGDNEVGSDGSEVDRDGD